MDSTAFYCSECSKTRPQEAGKTYCAVCQHAVCAAHYAQSHQPQDLHHVAAILTTQRDQVSENLADMDAWIADTTIPRSPLADRLLALARASLSNEAILLQKLLSEARPTH